MLAILLNFQYPLHVLLLSSANWKFKSIASLKDQKIRRGMIIHAKSHNLINLDLFNFIDNRN